MSHASLRLKFKLKLRMQAERGSADLNFNFTLKLSSAPCAAWTESVAGSFQYSAFVFFALFVANPFAELWLIGLGFSGRGILPISGLIGGPKVRLLSRKLGAYIKVREFKFL